MPWLSWSLKLLIRLRTILLLISIHNTQVYVQWIPYSFVWLNKMCFHMLNLCWFKHKKIFECFKCFWNFFVFTKRFLSVLSVFGKYFVFTKTERVQKQCCPILATQSRVIQVACYSRELAGRFWWLVSKWKVQSQGVHRDFHGSARNSLASETSSCEKHLANFFKSFGLKCFGVCPGDLSQSRKMRVLCFEDSFLKTFSIFPSNFCDCSLSSPLLSQLKLT